MALASLTRARLTAGRLLRAGNDVGTLDALVARVSPTPAFGKFLGLPLDVRHVTLSAGFLAAAASSLGGRALGEGAFLWAAGVCSMAVLNVGVSFSLALATAVRARSLRAPTRSAIRAEFWRRLRRRPADFVVPGEER